jgi:transposase InsO family protein
MTRANTWGFSKNSKARRGLLDYRQRPHDSRTQCGRCIHARVSGAGSRYRFCQQRVTRALDGVIAVRGRPGAIRCDNGPELTSRHFLAWALECKVELRHIQPGKPTQNAQVESFRGRLREECLRVSWFTNLWDARRKVTRWRTEYNEQRPHGSLGYRTPAEFAKAVGTESHGKDVGFAHLENASGVYLFPTALGRG